MVLPLFVVAYVYTLPESPRWLLQRARHGNKKKYEEAFNSICKLRHTKLQAARDLFLINYMLQGEEEIMQQQKPFSELFTVGRNRRALTASVIVMFLQQVGHQQFLFIRARPCLLHLSLWIEIAVVNATTVLRCKCYSVLQ